MFTRIRKRLTYANVALTVALVFAMSGGAYAAGKFLITSTKQIKPSVLAQLKGKSGARGAPGAAGATGPQGPAGPAGAAGKEGPAGKEGVVGKEGPQGPAGTNGTTGFTATLPTGKTLKGDWDVTAVLPGTGPLEGSATSAVSFGIPLGAAPEPIYVKAPSEEETEKHQFPVPPNGCSGTVEEPGAEPGHLCIFAATEHNINQLDICASGKPVLSCLVGGEGVGGIADPAGFLVAVVDKENGFTAANGTWAATAE